MKTKKWPTATELYNGNNTRTERCEERFDGSDRSMAATENANGSCPTDTRRSRVERTTFRRRPRRCTYAARPTRQRRRDYPSALPPPKSSPAAACSRSTPPPTACSRAAAYTTCRTTLALRVPAQTPRPWAGETPGAAGTLDIPGTVTPTAAVALSAARRLGRITESNGQREVRGEGRLGRLNAFAPHEFVFYAALLLVNFREKKNVPFDISTRGPSSSVVHVTGKISSKIWFKVELCAFIKSEKKTQFTNNLYGWTIFFFNI